MTSIKDILTIAASVIIAGVIAACSTDPVPDIHDEEKLTHPSMRITIAMSGNSRDGDSGFESGEGLENYLDIINNNYRIYFFSSDNTYHSTLKPRFSYDVTTGEDIGGSAKMVYYRFQGEVPDDLPETFKIVALFNWPKYPVEVATGSTGELVLQPGETTIEDICTHTSAQFTALTFPGDSEWLDAMDGRLIPFYGVREYRLTDHLKASDTNPDGSIKGGVTVDLSKKGTADTPLPILRAMAKVEVILDTPLASFEEVAMTRVNQKGFCSPYQFSTAEKKWDYDYSDYFPDEIYSWPDDFVRGVHLTFGADAKNNVQGTNDKLSDDAILTLKFKKTSERTETRDADGKILSVTPEKWVAYVPEHRNIKVDDFTTVRVRLRKPATANAAESADGDDSMYDKQIYFADGGKNDPSTMFDIERNNIYRFTITGMTIDLGYVAVDIQPFAEQVLNFGFGLMRDSRGDLMVIPTPRRDEAGNLIYDDNGEVEYSYPDYFIDFINDDNPKHKYPKEEDVDGLPTTGKDIKLTDGDYYAIVVGEGEEMTDAVVWVKDRTGCRVLSNFGTQDDDQDCSARLVQSFFGNNQSDKFYKDKFGYRRVYHFHNHNSIVRHPEKDNLLFCVITDFNQSSETRKYYEVESWDETSCTGWIINKDDDGREVGFQMITADGLLGTAVDLNGNSIQP